MTTSDQASPPADPAAIGRREETASGDAPAELRIVDRRWWARDDTTHGGDDTAERKPSYVEELEQRIASLDATVREYAGKYKTASQEFEEARARMRREVGKEAAHGRRAFLADLLEVVDNLDRAVAAGRTATDPASILTGVELVRTQFLAHLGRLGVTRLEAEGQPFDPTLHDAVSTTPAGATRDNQVVSVIKEGYRIGDEVLRPASVVVGRAVEHAQESGDRRQEAGDT